MASVTDKELTRIIKSREASGVYYLYGTDYYSIGQFKKALVSSVVSEEDSTFNLHEFEGKGLNVEELTDACENMPVFAEKLCVTVRDLDLNSERLSDSRMKLLLDTIKNIPETTVLIFYEPNTVVSDGKKGVLKDNKNKRIVDCIEKCGTVCHLLPKTRNECVKKICSMVSKRGASIEERAAGVLWDRCLGDMNLIVGELGKLTSYANGAVITSDMVELLTPESSDAKAYYLADAIAAGNTSRAMALFNELTEARTDHVYLMYTIAGSINDLYRARLALDYNHNVNEVMTDFGYPRNIEFRVKNAFSSVRHTSAAYLRRCNEILAQADMDMKATGAIPSVIIETAIVKMLSLPRE